MIASNQNQNIVDEVFINNQQHETIWAVFENGYKEYVQFPIYQFSITKILLKRKQFDCLSCPNDSHVCVWCHVRNANSLFAIPWSHMIDVDETIDLGMISNHWQLDMSTLQLHCVLIQKGPTPFLFIFSQLTPN